MEKIILCLFIIVMCVFQTISIGYTAEIGKKGFDLTGLKNVGISDEGKELLKKNGFVVTPGYENEIYDIYSRCKEHNEPIFVTTDAVLHTCHIFFDYLLRIIEIERLYDKAIRLTDKMLGLSINQYNEAKDSDVKEAARLNIGFFAVAKRQFNPEYKVGFNLRDIVKKEMSNITGHPGLKFRELLTYVKNPNVMNTPYAYEDYSQYVPRGHYTRNEKFERYFKALVWYGRIDFKLRPGKEETAITHGRKMTLQAILMADALLRDQEAYALWKSIYEPTAYFVGKTDDLCADDYMKLIKEEFPAQGAVDKYNDPAKLTHFIEKAIKLKPPKILSGAGFVENGEFVISTKGFRFMGQRFIPDSHMFQELVYGIKGKKEILKYTGKGKPFTMEFIPNVGPARALPRGLDILAVLGSKRALDILEREGDTEYEYYYDQLHNLKEGLPKSKEEWKQNLYFQWLYALLPLLEEREDNHLPGFMQNSAWTDKELQTALASWAELRHDTILYAKQSYTMMVTGISPQPKFTYGYVEPYPELYARIQEIMKDLRGNLAVLGIAPQGVSEKIKSFERLLAQLKIISEKELNHKPLSDGEYKVIWNIGSTLASMKQFSHQIMKEITSNTDEKMSLIADVHTDLNTKQVLEEGVGSPFNIYVIVEDYKGKRLCRGGVFSYCEFKWPLSKRLTDEQWQRMLQEGKAPPLPKWTNEFIAK